MKNVGQFYQQYWQFNSKITQILLFGLHNTWIKCIRLLYTSVKAFSGVKLHWLYDFVAMEYDTFCALINLQSNGCKRRHKWNCKILLSYLILFWLWNNLCQHYNSFIFCIVFFEHVQPYLATYGCKKGINGCIRLQL